MRERVRRLVARACQMLRQMVGVPDYDTYVRHVRSAHPGRPCMSYEEFFRERQLNRYDAGMRGGRCC